MPDYAPNLNPPTLAARTIAEHYEIAAEPPALWTDTQVARHRNFTGRLAASVEAQMSTLYSRTADHCSKNIETMEELARNGERTAEAIAKQLRNGTLNAAEGQRALTPLFRDLPRLRAERDATLQREAELFERVDKTPAEYQADVLRRFPALRNRLPRFTEDMLTGREPVPDFTTNNE